MLRRYFVLSFVLIFIFYMVEFCIGMECMLWDKRNLRWFLKG